MSYDKSKSLRDEVVRRVDELVVEVKQSEHRLHLLQQEQEPFREIEPYPELVLRGSTYYMRSPEDQLKVLDKWLADCQPVIERNQAAAEHNRRVVERATQYMLALGLKDSELNRSSRGKSKWETAGWKSSLLRQIPTSCGSASVTQRHESEKKRIESEIKKAEQEQQQRDRAAKAQQEAEEKARKRQLVIVSLAERYGQDPLTIGTQGLLDAILASDKYLHLAYWLERNRGDWSEGYDYAKTGLEYFAVDAGDAIDQQIVNCIQGHISDWGGDGRIFRDCEWNYDRIRQLASQQALKDYCAVVEFDERD